MRILKDTLIEITKNKDMATINAHVIFITRRNMKERKKKHVHFIKKATFHRVSA